MLFHEIMDVLSGPHLLVDESQLLHLVFALEHGLPGQHFIEDAPDCPHINRFGVVHSPQQQLRCSVVQCAHFIGHLDIFVPLYLLRHAEIYYSQVKAILVIQDNIGRLHIAMHHE